MNEKNQIEKERWDIARIMSQNFHINGVGWDESDFEWTAHCLQMEGYHKQSENVIELPCKVGDTVYEICEIANAYSIHKCIGFQYTKNELQVITADGFAKYAKTLKFSKEEAEQALKGGAE